MFGPKVVEIVEKTLKEKKISKGEFYKNAGISSATFSQWRLGTFNPSPEMLSRIESCLGINFGLTGGSQEQEKPTDEAVKFALFGTADIDDQLYEEVLRYAKYAQQETEKRKFEKFRRQDGE